MTTAGNPSSSPLPLPPGSRWVPAHRLMLTVPSPFLEQCFQQGLRDGGGAELGGEVPGGSGGSHVPLWYGRNQHNIVKHPPSGPPPPITETFKQKEKMLLAEEPGRITIYFLQGLSRACSCKKQHQCISCKGKVKAKLLSRVRLFTTPWTAAHQVPLSMEFSRQEYWSGLPFLAISLCISGGGVNGQV